jgi:serine O-acetyltransferase
MVLSQSPGHISFYISRQLNNLFPDKNGVAIADLSETVKIALDRLENCFSRVSNSRYNNGSEAIYNHLYSDHNIVFYWFLANSVWQETKNEILSSKLYYLNKVMHGFDCMYDTKLPDIFLVFHGVGTMLGKATYSDYFVVMQGCTVGSNNGTYPVFGKGVSLTANSSVIGNCTIGDLSTISTGTLVFEKNIGISETAFIDNQTGLVNTKISKESYSKQFFRNYL